MIGIIGGTGPYARTGPCPHGCDRALHHAILTAERARAPERVRRLDAAAGPVLRRDARP